MEKSTPTKEQIKELWEWCGFKLVDNSDYLLAECPIDYPLGFHLPLIDLNNLFKYAVPRLQPDHEVVLRWSSVEVRDGDRNYPVCPKGWEATVFGQKGSLIDTSGVHPSDPALALFWALDKVRLDK
ncbi:hypothetical protein LCGC14_3002040 [marine sediment metagenome]|uniref:Uncharacterized protein n=1 Tax=marine sediment metagenome TaxID=412755 RepID=A0A0F8XNC2_9ZZZZ